MNSQNLVPFQKGYDSRRQNGRKKGSKNVSTIIKDLLETDFKKIKNSSLKSKIEKQNSKTAKEAIISVIIQKALSGDIKSVEWLFSHIERNEPVEENNFFNRPIEITIIDPINKNKKLL